MTGLGKSPFFETNESPNQRYLAKLALYFLPGENIFKTFKNLDFFAHFTNKRILFTYCPESNLDPARFEIEFLPYRGIQRFSLLSDDRLSSCNIELSTCDIPFLSFRFSEKTAAVAFAKTISEFNT